jgi:hypothetical protein
MTAQMSRRSGGVIRMVRDTKDRTGRVLRFAPAAWRQFPEQLKGAECTSG